MKARKRPNIVDAFRYGIDTVPDWFQDMLKLNTAYIISDDLAMIRTEVNHEAFWGDVLRGYVVVKDVDGAVYSYEPSVFGLMFEVLER